MSKAKPAQDYYLSHTEGGIIYPEKNGKSLAGLIGNHHRRAWHRQIRPAVPMQGRREAESGAILRDSCCREMDKILDFPLRER